MASRLFGTKPLSEQMLEYRQVDPVNKFQWNSNRNTKLLVHENASENIACEMAGIIPREDELMVSSQTNDLPKPTMA